MGCELVVIGASWGGFAALERVIGPLPRDFGPAVAVAQHRAADSGSSALTRMLSARTARPVLEPCDKDAIRPRQIYVAPADYHLLVEPGFFALSVDEVVQYSRPSIDVLFDSAADAYGSRVIGVILTGANADGAYGIARIKRRGGVTIAQDPETAERRTMPEAAIATGAVDHVAPLEEIAPLLQRYAAETPGGASELGASAGRSVP